MFDDVNTIGDQPKKQRTYKCPICRTETVYKGVCWACISNPHYRDLIKSYYNTLEKKRKYRRGDPIKTFDELLQQEVVYMYGRAINKAFVYNQQFGMILSQLSENRIYYAIKKDTEETK